MSNIGVALAGGGGGARREHDFYATPPEAVQALCRSGLLMRLPVWEPACGDGAMCRALTAEGWKVKAATDLVRRHYGTGDRDFLSYRHSLAPLIVTNPPFALAEAFIRKAVGFIEAGQAVQAAMLLKASYWNAGRRMALLAEHPPSHWLPLGFRLDFTGGGAPTMDVGWAIWTAGVSGVTVMRGLPKPTLEREAVDA